MLELTWAFSVAVPTLWNSLPEDVKSSNSIVSFHHHLKTHLFRLVYPFSVSRASDHLLINFASHLNYEISQPEYRLYYVLGPPLSSILLEDIGAIYVCYYYVMSK